jgi:hypothetical protein
MINLQSLTVHDLYVPTKLVTLNCSLHINVLHTVRDPRVFKLMY